MGHEQGEQRPLLRAAQRERPALFEDLERAEDAKFHARGHASQSQGTAARGLAPFVPLPRRCRPVAGRKPPSPTVDGMHSTTVQYRILFTLLAALTTIALVGLGVMAGDSAWSVPGAR